MHRNNRVQAQREAAATNRAADSAALGTMAAGMVLGVMLPREADAKSASAGGPLALDTEQHNALQQRETAFIGPHINPVHGTNSGSTGAIETHSTASPTFDERADSHVGGTQSFPAEAGTFEAHDAETHSPGLDWVDGGSTIPGHFADSHQSATPGQPDGATINQIASDLSISHASNSFSGTIDGMFSSVSQSVIHAVDQVSTTLSGMMNGLTGALSTETNNPVESILSGHLPIADGVHLPDLPLFHQDSASDLLQATGSPSLASDLLGAPNGGMSQTFGAPETLSPLHPSALSFGDASNPMHIGFIGQALPLVDGHDLVSHGNGSLLHGFL